MHHVAAAAHDSDYLEEAMEVYNTEEVVKEKGTIPTRWQRTSA